MSPHFRVLHKVSVVAAILPPASAKPVIERLFASGERNAFVTNARGTLIRDQWMQRFLPLISPEKEILRFLVPDAQVDGVIRDIADAGGLRYPGSGAVYSVPCDDLYHTPDFPIWAGLDTEEPGTDATLSLRENLSAISCILQPEQTEAVSRAAVQAGAHGPVIFYCEGRGLRDRLGWLRITKKRTKEVVTLIVDNADADAIVEAIRIAGRLDMPGRGYLYRMPVQKGIVNLASRIGGRNYAADMQQVISAIDGLMGHTDWRRRNIVRLGGGGRAAGLGLESEDQADATQAHTRLTFIAGEAHTQMLLDTALSAGAVGANIMSARFVEAESKVAMGRRLNRERSWVQTVMPSEQAGEILKAVMEKAASEGVSEACLFAQPVTRVLTYRAQAARSAAPGRTYRGIPVSHER
ncbi:MAG: P-II family nitrogen regulator [Pseudomonadota bacterium]|nr:P-II family nitrogen regulator [Pseudomonadota bacterium]